MRRLARSAVLISVSILGTTSALAHLRFQQNGMNQTTMVAGLFPDGKDNINCSPKILTLTGRVVKRTFMEDAITLSSIVVETADGRRNYIEIPTTPDEMGNAGRSRATEALQRLTKVGRVLKAHFFQCGSGGIYTLDGIE